MTKRFTALGCALTVSVLALTTTAFADDDKNAAFYNAALGKVNSSLSETEGADQGRVASAEIANVRTLVGQGQAYVASDKLDEAAGILERAQVSARYARMKVERVGAESRATEAQTQATAALKAAADSKVAAETMQAKAKDLESRGL
ncbi:MAG: hypothetical protein H7Z43_00100 [Clostridia bacterium]|nr:hypothetical protein [Deltaproteobacteria bacterium]